MSGQSLEPDDRKARQLPALAGIDHPGPVTHGFVQDVEGHELGGIVPGHPTHALPERLLWLRTATRTSTASSSVPAIGQLDWLLGAVLLNLGVNDHASDRYVRPLEAGAVS